MTTTEHRYRWESWPTTQTHLIEFDQEPSSQASRLIQGIEDYYGGDDIKVASVAITFAPGSFGGDTLTVKPVPKPVMVKKVRATYPSGRVSVYDLEPGGVAQFRGFFPEGGVAKTELVNGTVYELVEVDVEDDGMPF